VSGVGCRVSGVGCRVSVPKVREAVVVSIPTYQGAAGTRHPEPDTQKHAAETRHPLHAPESKGGVTKQESTLP